jgi:hypothetical protein
MVRKREQCLSSFHSHNQIAIPTAVLPHFTAGTLCITSDFENKDVINI